MIKLTARAQRAQIQNIIREVRALGPAEAGRLLAETNPSLAGNLAVYIERELQDQHYRNQGEELEPNA